VVFIGCSSFGLWFVLMNYWGVDWWLRLSTATTGTDIISFYFDGTDYFGGSILDFS